LLEDQIHHANRLESLGTLAGGIAHDVNNSLVPVIAMTKRVLAKLPPDSSSRGSLELVLKGGERAKDLVQQILAFSRKEKGAKRPFDLANVAADALKLLRASIPSTITLAPQIDAVPLIEGDPGQWHQVILNLGTNAAQAIEHRIGTIALELRYVAGDDSIRLSVADTGGGMDDLTRQRVFEPFFTTKEVGRGTGLGLSVVHGIVVDHGGTISVASTPGAGTRFDIVLSVAALRPSEPTPDAAPSS
jgi:signal transduction histidine kinase